MIVRGHLLYARRYSKHLLSMCVFSLNSHRPMRWIRFMLISQMMKLRHSEFANFLWSSRARRRSQHHSCAPWALDFVTGPYTSSRCCSYG